MIRNLRAIRFKWVNRPRALVLLTQVAGFLTIAASAAWAQEPDFRCQRDIERWRIAKNTDDSASARTNLILCTSRADEKDRQTRLGQTDAEAMRLAKMFFDIPEYHDEGRLPVDRDRPGALLGPLAGIYASPFLHGFTRPAQIYEQGIPGTFAAIVVVDEKPGATLPTSYTNLHLHAGMNCVWLYVDPPSDGITSPGYLANLHYTARVSRPAANGTCDRSAQMNILPVTAVRNNRFLDGNDYPPVARFDTDDRGRPVLAIRCLNAFCEIGVGGEPNVRTPDRLPRPDVNRAQWDPLRGASVEQARRQVVKGWHDEQTLAVRGADFIWRASDVRATIRPDPVAAQYDSADFHDNWRRVATIQINRDVPTSSKYFGWGLRRGDNDIEFKYDATVRKWQARLVRSGSQPIVWSVMKRTVHHDVTVPPIARFRWTGADDGVWAPCGNACCKAAAQ